MYHYRSIHNTVTPQAFKNTSEINVVLLPSRFWPVPTVPSSTLLFPEAYVSIRCSQSHPHKAATLHMSYSSVKALWHRCWLATACWSVDPSSESFSTGNILQADNIPAKWSRRSYKCHLSRILFPSIEVQHLEWNSVDWNWGKRCSNSSWIFDLPMYDQCFPKR